MSSSLSRAQSWPLLAAAPEPPPLVRPKNYVETRRMLRTHYYPEGGWGWLVVAAGLTVQLLTHGLQLSAGVFIPPTALRFATSVTDTVPRDGSQNLGNRALKYRTTAAPCDEMNSCNAASDCHFVNNWQSNKQPVPCQYRVTCSEHRMSTTVIYNYNTATATRPVNGYNADVNIATCLGVVLHTNVGRKTVPGELPVEKSGIIRPVPGKLLVPVGAFKVAKDLTEDLSIRAEWRGRYRCGGRSVDWSNKPRCVARLSGRPPGALLSPASDTAAAGSVPELHLQTGGFREQRGHGAITAVSLNFTAAQTSIRNTIRAVGL
ncbi:hypothetical protein J6590_030314 [Homalodisca vitripennis]|nr:hypothetical protein J6590_030314 [Homalodisca vitripennis]